MQQYEHKIGAIFSNASEAHSAYLVMKASGFPENQLFLVEPSDSKPDHKIEPEGDEVLSSGLKDLLTGTAAGAGLGAGAAGIAAATGVTAFFAAPVLATLLAAGYGAMLGSAVGAGKALHVREANFAAMIKDAIRHGHAAIVAHAKDDAEEAKARELFDQLDAEESVGC